MEQIQTYFDLTARQRDQFAQLGKLYLDWNQKINVISRKDMDNFYEHHVLHSLAIAKFVQFTPGTKIMDIGTGGGFPGVPLAVMFPEAQFLLVDSIGKKLKVIDAVAQELGLSNVRTQHGRAENIVERFDFVTSRAVTRLNEAWSWVGHTITDNSRNTIPNGMLYLKGGEIDSEKPAGAVVQQYRLDSWFSEPYFAEKGLVHIYTKSA